MTPIRSTLALTPPAARFSPDIFVDLSYLDNDTGTSITQSRTPQGPPLDQVGSVCCGRRVYPELQGKDGT